MLEKPLVVTAAGSRRAGPWRLLEIFTWTCMVTLVAHRMGWDTFEPVTLPGWDLNRPEVRTQAREYLREVDPDFVVLAPPCGPWSQIQLINQRTPSQVLELQQKRDQARELLVFVEEGAHCQHSRGRAVVVENPKSSLIWKQAPLQSALGLPGMAAAVVDMCVYETPAGHQPVG